MPVGLDIATYLSSVTALGTIKVDIFAEFMPDTPDECWVCTSTQGLAPHRVGLLEVAGLMIRTRAARGATSTARDNCRDARNALNNLTTTTVNGQLYNRIEAQGSIAFTGTDEEDRPVWSINFLCWKTRDETPP